MYLYNRLFINKLLYFYNSKYSFISFVSLKQIIKELQVKQNIL